MQVLLFPTRSRSAETDLVRRRGSRLFQAVFAGCCLILASGAIAASAQAESLRTQVDAAIAISLQRLARSVDEVGHPDRYPTYATKDLNWQLRGSDDWTSGFYPGCLWLAHELSGDARFVGWAQQWSRGIEREKENADTHDLGFRFMCTFGNALRLNAPGEREHWKDSLHTAASTLARRFNPKVGSLSSNWDRPRREGSFPVVIDIMMNLELLYWSAANGGSPELATIATRHAHTTWRDLVRPDGGTWHVVRYDPATGAVQNKGTLQGAGDDTTWARGQAWAIYGFVICHRFTNDPVFLEHAGTLADYFLAHSPADRIAPWDFQSDIAYRDVSASAIVASALFELAERLGSAPDAERYAREADAMLTSLCREPWFASEQAGTNCLLDHSVQYLPINSNVDVPAIFADYYFLEALVRYRARHGQTTARH
jgi:unsaturated chondroitin disaccharide hydrolase